MPQCKAFGCFNRQGEGEAKEKSFFAFPKPDKDRKTCQLWLDKLKNSLLPEKVSDYKWLPSHRVCEDHFKEDCFYGMYSTAVATALNFTGKKLLKPGSVPSRIDTSSVDEHGFAKSKRPSASGTVTDTTPGTSRQRKHRVRQRKQLRAELTSATTPQASECETTCDQPVLRKKRKLSQDSPVFPTSNDSAEAVGPVLKPVSSEIQQTSVVHSCGHLCTTCMQGKRPVTLLDQDFLTRPDCHCLPLKTMASQDSQVSAAVKLETDTDMAEDLSSAWGPLNTTSDAANGWAGNVQGVPSTQPATANTTVDTNDIKAEPVTFTDTDTSEKQSFTDSGLLDGVKGEFVDGTDIFKSMNSDSGIDIDTSKYINSKSLTDTGSFKCEPVTNLDTWLVIKIEPITDTDTRTNNRAGPATTIQPVDDPAVSKTDTAVSMEPLPPREGQERLPSKPQPADKEVGFNNKGEPVEEEVEQEDEDFLFDDVPEDRTQSLSCEITQPAPGPAQTLASGASTLVMTNIQMFDEDLDIEDEDGMGNGDSAVEDTTVDSDSDTAIVCKMEIDIDTESDTDMESEVDHTTLPWERNLDGFPSIPRFRGRPGLQVDFGDDPSPMDIWSHIIDDDIVEHIQQETNEYAKSSIRDKQQQGPLDPRSIFATWREVSKADIYNFLAICLHMGLVKKLQVSDYWSVSPGTHTSYAAQVMPRERFTSILAFLHLNSNTTYIEHGQEGHDPIHKIRPFFSHLQEKFQALYVPKQEICVDEAMCPFKGKSRFRVYLKNKPTKWGFKFYELCESKSGYVYRLEMFCGQPGLSNKPYDVVMRLMEPLLNKGYHLYIDNYYCEPSVCAALAAKKTMVCGTVRKDRHQMPRDLCNKPLNRGQMDYRRRGSVVAVKWRDKKDVFMLSTMHKPQLQHTYGRYEEKDKPEAVIHYIQNMAGVDQSDRMIAYFPMLRESLKWWKKPFFYLLTLCTVQTMILLNKHRGSKRRRLMPLDQVVKSLLVDIPTFDVPAPADGGGDSMVPGSRLQRRHFPSVIPPTPCIPSPRKNCKVCYEKRKASGATAKELHSKRQQTHYECVQCIEKKRPVALCAVPCFEEYHSKEKYC